MISRLFLLLAGTFLVMSVSGCVRIVDKASCSDEIGNIAASAAIKDVFNELARELCDDSCTTGDPTTGDPATGKRTCRGATVLVTDFVDVQSYKAKRPGIFFGELMKSSLNEMCNYKIVQAELSEYFHLSDQGLTALTRNPREVKNSEYANAESVIGTYHFSGARAFLFARRINTYTGKIVKIASREIPLVCGGTDAVYHAR